LCIISLTRSKIASKTSERKTRVQNFLQPQPKKGRKKERHIIQKSLPTTFYEKSSTRTKKQKKKEKSTSTMDQQNTPHRASLILQTRSQDLDPGKAQRGNLSRKQNRKPKKQRARKTKEQELRRELDQKNSTAEEADKSQ
jgi:hypothetical protein